MSMAPRIGWTLRPPWTVALAVGVQVWFAVGVWLAVSFHMPAWNAPLPEWLRIAGSWAWVLLAWTWPLAGAVLGVGVLVTLVRARRPALAATCVAALVLEAAVLMHLEAPAAEALWWRWHGGSFRAAAQQRSRRATVRLEKDWWHVWW